MLIMYEQYCIVLWENNVTLKTQRGSEEEINQKQENRPCCIIYLTQPLQIHSFINDGIQ